jgi:hypothetical protein
MQLECKSMAGCIIIHLVSEHFCNKVHNTVPERDKSMAGSIILNFVSTAKPSKVVSGCGGGGTNLIIKHDKSLTFEPAACQSV